MRKLVKLVYLNHDTNNYDTNNYSSILDGHKYAIAKAWSGRIWCGGSCEECGAAFVCLTNSNNDKQILVNITDAPNEVKEAYRKYMTFYHTPKIYKTLKDVLLKYRIVG